MLLYVGSEVTLGGWIITFMQRIYHGEPFQSSLVSSGFWIGLTVGRFVLAWVTTWAGEKRMVSIYLIGGIGLELGFWLGGTFTTSAVFVALLGFCIGMVMPAVSRTFSVWEI